MLTPPCVLLCFHQHRTICFVCNLCFRMYVCTPCVLLRPDQEAIEGNILLLFLLLPSCSPKALVLVSCVKVWGCTQVWALSAFAEGRVNNTPLGMGSCCKSQLLQSMCKGVPGIPGHVHVHTLSVAMCLVKCESGFPVFRLCISMCNCTFLPSSCSRPALMWMCVVCGGFSRLRTVVCTAALRASQAGQV